MLTWLEYKRCHWYNDGALVTNQDDRKDGVALEKCFKRLRPFSCGHLCCQQHHKTPRNLFFRPRPCQQTGWSCPQSAVTEFPSGYCPPSSLTPKTWNEGMVRMSHVLYIGLPETTLHLRYSHHCLCHRYGMQIYNKKNINKTIVSDMLRLWKKSWVKYFM